MAISFASSTLLPATSMSANITSDPINLSKKEAFSVHAVYTGSPMGTLSLEASIDGVTYSTISGTTKKITEASDTLYNINQANYMWARLKYSYTSGSGSLVAYFSAKEDV